MGHCTPPASMTPVLDLPPPTFKVLCAHAAELVMRYDTAIAILGFAESGGVFCWRPCWARHPGAVLALPDLMVAQLAANGLGDTSQVRLQRNDGRSVHLYRTP